MSKMASRHQRQNQHGFNSACTEEPLHSSRETVQWRMENYGSIHEGGEDREDLPSWIYIQPSRSLS